MNAFGFQPGKHVHHVAGVFVAIAEQNQPLQMMRSKTADGSVDSAFDIGSTLIDRNRLRRIGNLHLFELVEFVKDGRIAPKGMNLTWSG